MWVHACFYCSMLDIQGLLGADSFQCHWFAWLSLHAMTTVRVHHSHRETMGLEGGVYLYHKMTPPPNLGHFWVVFERWSQILPSTKLFRHGFEQSCSAIVTQKLEEKVQQHDEVVESGKTVCRSQSRAHGKAYEQVPALICNSYARCILCAATILGG